MEHQRAGIGAEWLGLVRAAIGRWTGIYVYRLRRKDGGVDPFSAGTLVETNGQVAAVAALGRGRIAAARRMDQLAHRRPLSRPLAVALARRNLDLTITPKVADQEMRLTVRYWEGAVTVNGHARDQEIGGQGYLEMTRYETPVNP
jgi:predicted secreted hydrolase